MRQSCWRAVKPRHIWRKLAWGSGKNLVVVKRIAWTRVDITGCDTRSAVEGVMKLPIYQVNAFASKSFAGNPAAVCPLHRWLNDELLKRIAIENHLTTAFVVGETGAYELRWFTPQTEIEGLCGHGTLAAAFVISTELGDRSDQLTFSIRDGELRVWVKGRVLDLDFPALAPHSVEPPALIDKALGCAPLEVMGALDLMAVLGKAQDVAELAPDFTLLKKLPLRALIVTAPGTDVDFVSRWFGPKLGIDEDTGITGSAHCTLTPYDLRVQYPLACVHSAAGA